MPVPKSLYPTRRKPPTWRKPLDIRNASPLWGQEYVEHEIQGRLDNEWNRSREAALAAALRDRMDEMMFRFRYEFGEFIAVAAREISDLEAFLQWAVGDLLKEDWPDEALTSYIADAVGDLVGWVAETAPINLDVTPEF